MIKLRDCRHNGLEKLETLEGGTYFLTTKMDGLYRVVRACPDEIYRVSPTNMCLCIDVLFGEVVFMNWDTYVEPIAFENIASECGENTITLEDE